MSVFQKKSKSHLKTKLFFDQPVDIARYDVVKYPQLMKYTKKMRSFFWQPEEVDISKDKIDFSNLTKHEQHIFTANLKRQIVLDSVQGRAPVLAFLPIASAPELEPLLTWWTAFETLHSESYTHVIRNIYPNPSKVFDTILDIPQIMDCGTAIAKYYDKSYAFNSALVHGFDERPGTWEAKKCLWLALMSVNALEGIRFYVSFACSWAFAELKKMEGNAKIIKLIARDENCVTPDTEVLTPKGWVRIDNIDERQSVAQYNKGGSIEFVKPNKVIKKHYEGDLYHFTNKRGSFSSKVTDNHRVIWRTVDGEIKENTAEDFNPACNKHFIVSGISIGKENEITAKERFLIALQADGHIPDRNGIHTGCVPAIFQLKKERKKERLRTVLDECGFEYTETVDESKKGFSSFYVKCPLLELGLTKNLSDWVNLSDKSYQWCRDFIHELVQWDGHTRECDLYYSSTVEDNVNMVQAIGCLAGYKTFKSVQEDNRKETYSNVYRIWLTDRDYVSCGPKSTNKVKEAYQGDVYCVNVDSGMFITRHNDAVIVTGNCHLGITTMLLKLLKEDDEDFVKIAEECEEESINIFTEAIEAEKAWASYLFQDGSMLGLNEKLLCNYVEWIGHKRMKAVGLTSPYSPGRTNPLPWTEKWVAGGNVQVAPQEVEVSSYKIGDIKNDTDKLRKNLEGFQL